MFSKNDRFTLIATALLGILLYAWVQFAKDLQEAPTVEAVVGWAIRQRIAQCRSK